MVGPQNSETLGPQQHLSWCAAAGAGAPSPWCVLVGHRAYKRCLRGFEPTSANRHDADDGWHLRVACLCGATPDNLATCRKLYSRNLYSFTMDTHSGHAVDTQWTHSGHTVDTQWTLGKRTKPKGHHGKDLLEKD